MNILEQSKNEEFVKEQFIKGRILDDTKDYGRTQFVDEIYKLQQENQQLKIQVSSREEVANKYKEVIDKATKYINDEIKREAFHHYLDDKDIQELLDILKEVDKEVE